MIEFVKDWQAYRAGATAEVATLGGGVVDVLTKRGIVRPVAPTAAVTTETPARATKKPARR